MSIVKIILLVCIFFVSVLIGKSIARKYYNRVQELKEMQRALNIFEEKIKFTYQPIPDVFEEIAESIKQNIGEIFKNAAEKMQFLSAGEAWENAIDEAETKFNSEDIEILKGLSKMLGRTDLDGQVNEIRLTEKFIETKIEEAEFEKRKNTKLFKTLGVTVGLTIVIVLI